MSLRKEERNRLKPDISEENKIDELIKRTECVKRLVRMLGSDKTLRYPQIIKHLIESKILPTFLSPNPCH